MPADNEVQELESDIAGLAEALFASGTVEGTLRELVTLAQATVDACDGAAVFHLREDGSSISLAASGDLITSLDQAQIDTGEGPCLDAAASGEAIYAPDLTTEDRWPAFTAATGQIDLRSVLALPLSDERRSALILVATLPAAFGVLDRAKAQVIASLARLALDSAERQAASDERSVNLQAALRSRELIGQAQGILMERERISASQAFDILRRASQHLNIKLSAVAETLVETGEAPDTGPAPSR